MNKYVPLLLAVLLLGGCQASVRSSAGQGGAPPAAGAPATPIYVEQGGEKHATIRISAQGYGAPPKRYYPDGQRKLMAMRAAKLDAYRALAERIHGLHIWGGTSIGEMVVEKDRLRALVDAYVLGAKLVSVTAAGDETYEATVEAVVDQQFLSQVFASRPRDLVLTAEPVFVQILQPGAASEARDKLLYFEDEVPPNFYYSESD